MYNLKLDLPPVSFFQCKFSVLFKPVLVSLYNPISPSTLNPLPTLHAIILNFTIFTLLLNPSLYCPSCLSKTKKSFSFLFQDYSRRLNLYFIPCDRKMNQHPKRAFPSTRLLNRTVTIWRPRGSVVNIGSIVNKPTNWGVSQASVAGRTTGKQF